MSLINERISARNRISDDERVFRTELASSQHRRRTPWACRSACSPARGGIPAMIIVRAVTSDGPDGQPWPPAESNVLWVLVARADGRTLWRTIELA
jgi:hypothetical protein